MLKVSNLEVATAMCHGMIYDLFISNCLGCDLLKY